jgi:4-oxalocrotonate tautomerase
MPFVTINMLAGRTLDQKRKMVKDVTAAIVKNVGCPDAAVQIIITELQAENLAQAGNLRCDSH